MRWALTEVLKRIGVGTTADDLRMPFPSMPQGMLETVDKEFFRALVARTLKRQKNRIAPVLVEVVTDPALLQLDPKRCGEMRQEMLREQEMLKLLLRSNLEELRIVAEASSTSRG